VPSRSATSARRPRPGWPAPSIRADQSERLYEQLGATVGLIGVGADNDYGHPAPTLLDLLAATGTTALRTDVDGLILLAPGDRPGEVDVWTAR
jgi:competence protein ComEC